jgi:hypothetical protein
MNLKKEIQFERDNSRITFITDYEKCCQYHLDNLNNYMNSDDMIINIHEGLNMVRLKLDQPPSECIFTNDHYMKQTDLYKNAYCNHTKHNKSQTSPYLGMDKAMKEFNKNENGIKASYYSHKVILNGKQIIYLSIFLIRLMSVWKIFLIKNKKIKKNKKNIQ